MPPPAAAAADGEQTALVKPRTKRGKRALERRAPKLVEDAKRALFLVGGSASAVIKDVLTDLHKLKGVSRRSVGLGRGSVLAGRGLSAGGGSRALLGPRGGRRPWNPHLLPTHQTKPNNPYMTQVDSVKFSRKNEAVKPFEPGGETALEFFAQKSNCSLFALGSHIKKRPHNLTLGRLFDFRLYDALELGVERHRAIKEFGGAASAQVGNKPAMLFVGERFEGAPEFRLAKSLLLDFFRGLEVRWGRGGGAGRAGRFFRVGGAIRALSFGHARAWERGMRGPAPAP
jgi:ribosome production factor 2